MLYFFSFLNTGLYTNNDTQIQLILPEKHYFMHDVQMHWEYMILRYFTIRPWCRLNLHSRVPTCMPEPKKTSRSDACDFFFFQHIFFGQYLNIVSMKNHWAMVSLLQAMPELSTVMGFSMIVRCILH